MIAFNDLQHLNMLQEGFPYRKAGRDRTKMKDSRKKWMAWYKNLERRIFPQWIFNPENAEHRQRWQIGFGTAFIAVIVLVLYAMLAFKQNNTILGIIELVVVAALAGIVLYFRRTKGPHNYAIETGVFIFGCFCLYLLYSGSAHSSTFVWFYTFPLIAMFIMGSHLGAIATTLIIFPMTFILMIDHYIPLIAHYSADFKTRFIPSLVVVSVLSFLYERNRENAQKRLNFALIELNKSKEEIEQQVNERTLQLHQTNQILFKEIKERLEIEKALRESGERFRQITESAGEWIWEVDANGLYTFSSPVIEKLLGYIPEELVGKKYFYDLFVPENREEVKKIVLEIFVQKKSFDKLEIVNLHKNGSVKILEMSGLPIVDEKGNLKGYRGTDTDISERRRAEEMLRESEECLWTVFSSVEDFIFLKDRERRYVLVNNFFKKRLQIEPSIFIGNTDAENPIFENREVTEASIRETDEQVLLGETVEYEIERCISGHRIIFHVIKTPIYDKYGNITSICGIGRDVTERRRLEEELVKARKLESVGILAGGIAHDFNNLLAVIQGYIELAKSSVPPEDRAQNYLVAAQRATMQTADLTKRLITFSKGGEPIMKPCDISELVKDVVQRIAATTPVEKKYFIHGDVLPVTVDEGQISQVIRNIASNALDAMPEGGTLTIGIQNVMVHRHDHLPISEGMYVRISLEDTGAGISENDLPHIFDPYYSKKERGIQKGMGLGLAVCYSVVSRHNGYIKVESKEGQGSAFHIYLPAAHEFPHLKMEDSTEKRSQNNGSQNIFIKDDAKVQ